MWFVTKFSRNYSATQVFVISFSSLCAPVSLSVAVFNPFNSSSSSQDRLGCAHDNGFQDILDHKFFAPISWEDLLNKQVGARLTSTSSHR